MPVIKVRVSEHVKNEVSTKSGKAGLTESEYVRQALEDRLKTAGNKK